MFADQIRLSVANLPVFLDARGAGLSMTLPTCHPKFLTNLPHDNGLALVVKPGWLERSEGWKPVFSPPKTWELWKDDLGRLVFIAANLTAPDRQIVVDVGFTTGEVFCDVPGGNSFIQPFYPLKDIDIILFANILGNHGDLILHASGISLCGDGYCFVGASGAGKSTLVGGLAPDPAVTVLGEDQVILRFIDGRFWIFGTPWHLVPNRCSPLGVPLKKLFFLDRTLEPSVTLCNPLKVVSTLLQTAFVPYYRKDLMPLILDRLSLFTQQVPSFTLSYRLGTDVLKLILDA